VSTLSEREVRWLGEGATGPVNVFRGVAGYRSAGGRRVLLALDGPKDAPPGETEEWKDARDLLLAAVTRRGAVREVKISELKPYASRGCTLIAPRHQPGLVIKCPGEEPVELHRPYGYERDLAAGWRLSLDAVLELLRLSGRGRVEAFGNWLVARTARNRRLYLVKLEEETQS